MGTKTRVLVTGGAGYIGSHTCKRLAADGFEPVVYDNLTHGHLHNVKWGPFIKGDILDKATLDHAFQLYRPAAVIHFAAYAYVGESVLSPSKYYWNNVGGTLSLLDSALAADVKAFVFSSTCATYGIPAALPIREDTPQHPINPYGSTKLMVERILEDYSAAYGLSFAALRYFNACGADLDGELAEEHEPETHLIPRCLQAAAGLIEAVEIFGTDYPTPDGTCIRDYIHVSDLAAGHVGALRRVLSSQNCLKLNLGTGRGISVREILSGIEGIVGCKVPHVSRPRRPGDPPELLADATLARSEIGFAPSYSDLDTILRTAWRQYDFDRQCTSA